MRDRSAAFADLGRALDLNPGLAPARYARALFSIEEQRPAAAVDDLSAYLQREPNDARALAHLGQAYLALDKTTEAGDVLKRAVELAPASRFALLQYRKLLMRVGRTQEAEAILARLKESEAASEERRPEAGLIQYLNLAPAERRSRYLASLRAECAANRSDLGCQLRLGGELFAEGAATEAVAVFEQLKSSATGPQVSAECGRVLVDFEQYDLARPFLERALASEPGLSTARLDLAIVKCGNSRGFQDVDLVAAQGNGGQKIYVVPEYKLIAVFTGGGYNAESTPPNTIMAKVTLPRLMQAVNSGKASSPDK